MTAVFYISGAVAVVATIMVITRLNAVHALLYLIVSLLAVAVTFYALGAPFAAALEVIVYAGAIMVLFVFVIMLLNLGPASVRQEREWLTPGIWSGPALLAAILVVEMVYVFLSLPPASVHEVAVGPKEVGQRLFAVYLLGVDLVSFLLLAGMVGAYHIGKRSEIQEGKPE